jgi:hypothetical protein
MAGVSAWLVVITLVLCVALLLAALLLLRLGCCRCCPFSRRLAAAATAVPSPLSPTATPFVRSATVRGSSAPGHPPEPPELPIGAAAEGAV